MTRPHGHPLGSVAATLALSDWERRTALAAPDYDLDETEDDDPGADLPEQTSDTTEEPMTDAKPYADPITTPEALAAHIAAELEDTMPERLDRVIVTTGRSGSVVRVRVQGIDLDAPDGTWVRRFDVLVREAIS